MYQRVRNSISLSLLLTLALIVGNINSLSITNDEIFEAKNLEETLRLIVPKRLYQNFQHISSNYKDNQTLVSDTCRRDLDLLVQALISRELWALKMLDASSKIPSGILQGNLIDLGMFDECIAILEQLPEIEIRGHHCMYTMNVTYSDSIISPLLSICTPTSCTSNDITSLINNTINEFINEKLEDLELDVKIDSVTCSSVDSKIWDVDFIVCFSILIGYVGVLVICSMCDIVLDYVDVDHSIYPLLRCLSLFSLQRSVAAIFNTEVREGNLPVIHGIRFLSMAWIILGHRYVSNGKSPNINPLDIVDWTHSWKSLYIFAAPFAVDTFFAISGLLMTYIFLKQIPKQKIFNIPMYYLHRYLRLTPAVIALIVFTIVFKPKIGSGPRWETLQSQLVSVKWWPTLLYIQNFMRTKFLEHLWYLSVDMQLFWISPLILYPLYKKPNIGLVVLGIMFFISIVIPATVIAVNEYPISSLITKYNETVSTEVFNSVYSRPYHRAAPWIVGIFFGFDIVNNNRKLSKLLIYTGWLFMTAAFSFCILGTKYFMVESYEYNNALETFFWTVSKPLWGFGVCWIIYASIYNHTGPIAKFLSWKAFLPLSRLSYCIYLVHTTIQNIEISSVRTHKFFSDYYIWEFFFADFMISLVVGFFFSLLFESPVIILEKLIFKRKRESHRESQDELRPTDEENIRDKKF